MNLNELVVALEKANKRIAILEIYFQESNNRGAGRTRMLTKRVLMDPAIRNDVIDIFPDQVFDRDAMQKIMAKTKEDLAVLTTDSAVLADKQVLINKDVAAVLADQILAEEEKKKPIIIKKNI